MNLAMVSRVPLRSSTVTFSLTILSLAYRAALRSRKSKKKRTNPTPNPTATLGATATPRPLPRQRRRSIPRWRRSCFRQKIGSLTRSEIGTRRSWNKFFHVILLIRSKDRDRQSKARLHHASYVRPHAAYQVAKDRKLIRSDDSFTVEGLARDVAHELTEDHPRNSGLACVGYGPTRAVSGSRLRK